MSGELDIVLAYLERLRGMTDSPRLLSHIDEVEADRHEELAQRRGEELAREMRRDGSLKAKSAKREICGHCRAPFRGIEVSGYATVGDQFVCHPDRGKDCYRLVTVYQHAMPCDCGTWSDGL